METESGRVNPMAGRARFPKPYEGYRKQLPDDLKVIVEVTDHERDMTTVVVEGDRLPPWTRGNTAWEFKSMADMLDYRRGNHG